MSAFFITMDAAADGGFQPVKAVNLADKRLVISRSPVTTHCPELADDIAKAWAEEEGLTYKRAGECEETEP